MDEIIYYLSKLIPYIFIFLIILAIIAIIFSIISYKKINSKNIAIFGLFMDLKTKDIISISLLILYYINVVASLFINEITIITLIILITPIIIFNIINKTVFKLIKSIISTLFIYLLLIFKSIFFNYLIDVSVLWYVVLIFAILCIFIFLYSSYSFVKNIDIIVKDNQYVKRTKNNK